MRCLSPKSMARTAQIYQVGLLYPQGERSLSDSCYTYYIRSRIFFYEVALYIFPRFYESIGLISHRQIGNLLLRCVQIAAAGLRQVSPSSLFSAQGEGIEGATANKLEALFAAAQPVAKAAVRAILRTQEGVSFQCKTLTILSSCSTQQFHSCRTSLNISLQIDLEPDIRSGHEHRSQAKNHPDLLAT